MGRGHTIPGQPHPSHPAQKGEIMRRSTEPKHLKETEKPKAPEHPGSSNRCCICRRTDHDGDAGSRRGVRI